MRPTCTIVTACSFSAAIFLSAAPAAAHHEAILGPQAALVMSRENYMTGQMFTKQAVLIGVEARPFSLIAYGYGHRHGEYESFRESASMFVGPEERGHLSTMSWKVDCSVPSLVFLA